VLSLGVFALRRSVLEDLRHQPPPAAPQTEPAERELHFDDRPLLPLPGAAPIVQQREATSTAPAAPSSLEQPAPPSKPAAHLGRQRWVQLARLRARMGAGLCADADAASEAQDQLRSQFRALDWGDTARVYVDPRLPRSVDAALLQELDQTEREVGSALGVLPPRPDVFAYFDQALLQNKSCADESVSAFYDGALHALVTERGMLQRLLRQYARHALVSRGLVGPSWAREGIALEIARESGWREPSVLARIANPPAALDALEHELPDIASAPQADLFYARAAAMVRCALRQRSDGLPGLITELDVKQARGELSYRIPSGAEPAQLRSCLAALSR
jgi:hypothetical protein